MASNICTDHMCWPCGVKQTSQSHNNCSTSVSVSLSCGHTTTKTCGAIMRYRSLNGKTRPFPRVWCRAPCSKMLVCGHACANGCRDEGRHTKMCMEACGLRVCFSQHVVLPEGRRTTRRSKVNSSQDFRDKGKVCSKVCHEACIECDKPCENSCIHSWCTKKCHEPCNRPPCEKQCNHIHMCCNTRCIGLCGEPCPPCPNCNSGITCPITFQTLQEMKESNERAYVLPECGCVFSVKALDDYFSAMDEKGEKLVALPTCPKCEWIITLAPRYERIIKEKRRMYHDWKALVRIQKTASSLVRGSWYQCVEGHYYVVGNCGSAVESSRCPDCKKRIGVHQEGSNEMLGHSLF